MEKNPEDPEAYLDRFPAFKNKLRKLFKELEPEADEPSSSGRVVGEFRIVREIGSGGMATVYEAEQISLKRRVALKVLSPSLSLSRRAVQKFQREAEAGGRQAHPGIVAIYATGEEEGIHFIAQELVPGGFTLADRLESYRREGNLPMGYFRHVAEQILEVAEALTHAHASGVIHRDVKPSNILITEENHLKLTDFGLARVENALALSRTGDFSGTPFYMSPEQAMGRREAMDARTDVFSLGVTLYEALTLVRPFDGDSSHEVLRKIVHHEPKNLHKLNARVPRDLSVICLTALEKSPAHRYPTMAEFAQDLRRFLANEPIVAKPAGALHRLGKWIRRHQLASLAGAAVLLAVTALAILGLVLSKQREAEHQKALARFKPVREAFHWNRLPVGSHPGRWCVDADSRDPGGYLLQAFYYLETGSLERAEEDLRICIKRYDQQEETRLACDARYLLGTVLRRQAEQSGQDTLLEEAEALIREGGGSDSMYDDFILKEGPVLRINEEHYLVRLFMGISLFNALYKGGEIGSFEEAIGHLEAVLAEHPDHVTALFILGRIYYFLARFYHFHELLAEADGLLTRAKEHSGSKPYYLIPATMGQVELLKGNESRALEYFQEALDAEREDTINIHNAYVGMARVHARLGAIDEALKALQAAHELQPDDPHVNMASAEVNLLGGETKKALQHAQRAKKQWIRRRNTKSETFVASAHLVLVRILLEQGEYQAAREGLEEMYNIAVYSPRDFGLACYLIATMSGELNTLVSDLASIPSSGTRFSAEVSPILLGSQGVDHYLNGRYGEAVSRFRQAVEERKKWPDDAGRSRAHEDMRDLFFLAMARYENDPKDDAWKADYEEAERLFSTNPPSLEELDIIVRVRGKAREVLGITDPKGD